MLTTAPVETGSASLPSQRPTEVDPRLRKLVEDGTLTDDQARAVCHALARAVPSAKAEGTVRAAAPVRHWSARLLELGGYLGAALVSAAAAIAVSEQWESMGRVGQTMLMVLLALALGGSALAVVRLQTDRASGSLPAVWRRLASTLFTLASLATAAALGIVMLPSLDEDVTQSVAGRALLLASVGALLVLAVARWLAPSALAELGVFAAVLAFAGGFLVIAAPDTPEPIALTFFVIGVGWALLGAWTEAVTVPTLAEALGMGFALFSTSIGGDTSVMNPLLAVLVLVGMVVYALRPNWPFLVAAMLSAVALIVSIFGATLGPVFALLAAGLVLILFAVIGLALQRRRASPTGRVTDEQVGAAATKEGP